MIDTTCASCGGEGGGLPHWARGSGFTGVLLRLKRLVLAYLCSMFVFYGHADQYELWIVFCLPVERCPPTKLLAGRGELH